MANLCEQDLATDLLNEEKRMMGMYSTFISESNCTQLRNILLNQYAVLSNDQYRLFDAMNQKGFYQVKNAPENEVQQAKEKQAQAQQQLNAI